LRDFEIQLHVRGAWQSGYRDTLQSTADAAGVPRQRIVCHEPGAPDEMVRLASSYDVGLSLDRPVAPNNEMLLPNKTFTYLLAGLAVLTTRTRSQGALARELGQAAVTYEVGAVEELAAALRVWLEQPERLAAARAAAWRLGETTYNWDVEKQRFLGVVRKALSAS
jgi:glycosyltransferase involved in cell wall biosynthesis